jgi:hypothetical protein
MGLDRNFQLSPAGRRESGSRARHPKIGTIALASPVGQFAPAPARPDDEHRQNQKSSFVVNRFRILRQTFPHVNTSI